jgi:primosomal protein N' (replication factor Y)
MPHIVSVLVPTPKQSHLPDALSYWAQTDLAAGTLVKVPLGPRVVLGIVWPQPKDTPTTQGVGKRAIELKWIVGVLEDFQPLSTGWLDLVSFSAQYYQRSPGEVALWGLPPQLKNLSSEQIHLRLKRWQKVCLKFKLSIRVCLWLLITLILAQVPNFLPNIKIPPLAH